MAGCLVISFGGGNCGPFPIKHAMEVPLLLLLHCGLPTVSWSSNGSSLLWTDPFAAQILLLAINTVPPRPALLPVPVPPPPIFVRPVPLVLLLLFPPIVVVVALLLLLLFGVNRLPNSSVFGRTNTSSMAADVAVPP